MSAVIYYFSATGNSLYAAKNICEELGDCSLISMAALYHEKMVAAKAEVIGVVFPTHYFGLPPLVEEFIKKIKLEGVRYIFAVVTSGSSQHLNSSLHHLNKLLVLKDQKLSAGFHVKMISSYIPLSDIPPTLKVSERLVRADITLRHISRIVAMRKTGQDSEGLWRPFSAVNRYWKNNLLKKSYSKFTSSAACTSCGNCVQVCPVGNITLRDGSPHWAENCQECLACLHLCPTESIELGTVLKGENATIILK